MAYVEWTSERILANNVPLILSGPILRKVTSTSVSVWVALKKPSKIVLSIKEGGSERFKSTSTSTRKIGDNLHVALVTAKSGGKDLASGKIYEYDLTFDGASLSAANIFSEKDGIASLCYGEHKLPSFVLAPDNWEELRILHGSCRQALAPGFDGLVAVDEVLLGSHSQAKTEPGVLPRPHMLCMTGDQIYADHVSPTQLYMLMNIAEAVIAGKGSIYSESFWDVLKSVDITFAGETSKIDFLVPQRRHTVALQWSLGLGNTANHLPINRPAALSESCNFTSEVDASQNHLFTFGEYCAIYLMMWSDVLWPKIDWAKIDADPKSSTSVLKDAFPEYKKVVGFNQKNGHLFLALTETKLAVKDGQYVLEDEDLRPLAHMHRTLSRVRRALANIPTYMIMDDHDVADDAFITANWCARVLGGDRGRQVVRNALKAYAVFQAWGNAPTHFEKNAPGGVLLDLMSTKGEGANNRDIEWRLGIPAKEQIFEPSIWDGKVDSPEKLEKLDLSKQLAGQVSKGGVTLARPRATDGKLLTEGGKFPFLEWYFVLNFKTYQLIFLDTRTWRSFPGYVDGGSSKHGFAPCQPISAEGIEQQIKVAAKPDSTQSIGVTFVVNPLPFVDVPGLGYLREKYRRTTNEVAKWYELRSHLGFDNLTTDIEGWDSYRRSFELILSTLATRVPSPLALQSRIVVMSGDIHHSFGVRCRYWAQHAFGTAGPQPVDAIFALFTASAFKKNDRKTRALHQLGYEALKGAGNRRNETLFFGWKFPPSEERIGEIFQSDQVNPTGASLCWVPLPEGYPSVALMDNWIETAKAEHINNPVPNRRTWIKLLKTDDWRYRVDHLNGSAREVPATPKITSGGKSGIKEAAKAHRDAMFTYPQAKGRGRQLVGVHNVGDIYFDMIDSRRQVVQATWWSSQYDWKNATTDLVKPVFQRRTTFVCDFDFAPHPVFRDPRDYLEDISLYQPPELRYP